jgi:hypothetical protein
MLQILAEGFFDDFPVYGAVIGLLVGVALAKKFIIGSTKRKR